MADVRRDRRDHRRRVALAVASRPWLRAPAALALASLSAEVLLVPIGALIFQRVTLAGLGANLVAVPCMAVAQVAAMVTTAADWMHLAAGRESRRLDHAPQRARPGRQRRDRRLVAVADLAGALAGDDRDRLLLRRGAVLVPGETAGTAGAAGRRRSADCCCG